MSKDILLSGLFMARGAGKRTYFGLSGLLLVILLALLSHTRSFADTNEAKKRIALVIGNSAYKNVDHLPNPVNDARDVAAALKRIGFSVTELEDVSYIDFRNATLEFKKISQTADMAILYFAGHGVEVDRENWLLPIDVELKNDVDANTEAISLRWAMHAVESARTLGLVILDACRNNPFKIAVSRGSASRGIEVGLGPVDAADNVLVAYAARHGTIARDGMGKNSPFTTSLLRYIETPGLEVDFLFRNVRDDVIAATDELQQPVVYGSLSSDEIYLVPPKDDQESAAAPDQPDAGDVAWAFLQDTVDIVALKEFCDHFKENKHTADAETRIAWLKDNPQPVSPKPTDINGSQAPIELASAIPEKQKDVDAERTTSQKATARIFRRDNKAIKEAWDVVRKTRDQQVIRRFADQFPSPERRLVANKRLTELGQPPIRFNNRPLPAPTQQSPDRIQQAVIERAEVDADVLSCVGSSSNAACGRALVKYPALGEFLNRGEFRADVCRSISRPPGDCQGLIATNSMIPSSRVGANSNQGSDPTSNVASTSGSPAAPTPGQPTSAEAAAVQANDDLTSKSEPVTAQLKAYSTPQTSTQASGVGTGITSSGTGSAEVQMEQVGRPKDAGIGNLSSASTQSSVVPSSSSSAAVDPLVKPRAPIDVQPQNGSSPDSGSKPAAEPALATPTSTNGSSQPSSGMTTPIARGGSSVPSPANSRPIMVRRQSPSASPTASHRAISHRSSTVILTSASYNRTAVVSRSAVATRSASTAAGGAESRARRPASNAAITAPASVSGRASTAASSAATAAASRAASDAASRVASRVRVPQR